jgi:hypothetical protein
MSEYGKEYFRFFCDKLQINKNIINESLKPSFFQKNLSLSIKEILFYNYNNYIKNISIYKKLFFNKFFLAFFKVFCLVIFKYKIN